MLGAQHLFLEHGSLRKFTSTDMLHGHIGGLRAKAE